MTMRISVIPWAFSLSTCHNNSGFPATSTMGFGISSFVRAARRVPFPPAMITACICTLSVLYGFIFLFL